MDPSLYYLNRIAVCNFLTVLYLLVFAVWGLSLNPRARTNQRFFFMCLHALVWQLGIGFMLCSRDPGLAERWYRFSYLGVVFVGPGVLLFTSSIPQPGSKNRLGILVAYVLTFLFGLEGVLGRSVITGVWEYSWGFYPRYGSLSFVFLALFTLIMGVVFRNLIRGMRRAPSGFEKKQIKALILAFSVAFLSTLDFVPCFGIGAYPVGFLPIAIFVTLMFGSVYRYQLLDPTPESLARKVLATIADSIIVLDAEGYIRMVNPKAEDLLGYTRDQMLQRHFSSFVDPRSMDASQSLVRNLGPWPKDVESGVITLRHRDGKPIPTSANLSSIPGWKGRILGVVLACRDLQEIVRSQQIIREQEEVLRETQERYSALFNRSLFCVFVHDFEGNFLDANQAALDLLGYSREEISSINFASLLCEDQLPDAVERAREMRQTGYRRKGLATYKLITKSGKPVWVETEASLIYRGGRPYAVQGIARDVTERLRAEEELRESEARYRTLVDSAPESIVVVDVDGRIRSCNLATTELTGYGAEELEGKYIHELMTIGEEEMPRVRKLFENLVLGKEVEAFELENIRKDGTRQWTVVKLRILKSYGEMTGILVVSRDLTERKRMEEQLRESEQRYRMLFESSPEAITLVGLDGTILDCNQATTNLTGLAREELVGKSFAKLGTLHEEKIPAYIQILERLIGGELVMPLEHQTIDREKRAQWTENYMSLLKRQNEPFAVQVISRDVTERKRAEEQLHRHHEQLKELVEERTAELQRANEKLHGEIAERIQVEDRLRRLNEELDRRVRERTEDLEKANEELKELDRMKDSFLSSVSHEFRTPLTSIRSFSEILLRYEQEDPETRKEFLRIINSESERLTRLVNDVLDISRIEAEGMVWNDAVLSLEEVIRDIVPAQQKLLQTKSLRLILDLSPELPPVRADHDRILQVITNLLGNAVKFSHRNGEIRIKAEAFPGRRSQDPSTWVKVSISDEGIGIDPKDFDVIFEKFRQVSDDTLKDKPEGTGLGLPICKEIVAHYGGRIWVESRKGEGSSFHFTLPAHTVDAGVRCGDLSGSEQPLPVQNGKTILVVDDDSGVRNGLRMQLEEMGYPVYLAENADEAIEILKTSVPDLVILDVIMPQKGGPEVLAWIRNNVDTCDLPVIMLSGFPLLGELDVLRSLGIEAYVEKSDDLSALFSKVDSILEARVP